MKLVTRLHNRHVHSRRVRVLCAFLRPLIPAGARVLDLGSGDGQLAAALLAVRPDIEIQGIDTLVRPSASIPVSGFDGRHVPFRDGEFDAVLLVDVLHHAEEPGKLLAEALRVSRGTLVLKDHLREGFLASVTLRFMDWMGNAGHGVALPHAYWSRAEWRAEFARLGLTAVEWNERPDLYPPPASWLFGRSLHFVARLAGGKST